MGSAADLDDGSARFRTHIDYLLGDIAQLAELATPNQAHEWRQKFIDAFRNEKIQYQDWAVLRLMPTSWQPLEGASPH